MSLMHAAPPCAEHPLRFARDGVGVHYHPFAERPLSDACWSLQAGPDRRIYAAACVEHTGGETATVVRYDRNRDGLEYLFDLDTVTGDLRDSGRATQCKIHYSFAPDAARGVLYAATHLSGPPKGRRGYNPWSAWHDPAVAFRGAYLVTYDTARDAVVDSLLMIPREGCRCLCFDPGRRRLYALTYPRDHFVYFDLATRRLHDRGRIGSVNGQCLFTDPRGRVYTFADTGRMLRFDPDADRLEELPHVFPHEPYQDPRHGVLYDAVEDPEGDAVYGVPWRARPHLVRFRPGDGPAGRLEDLGRLTQAGSPSQPVGVNSDHVGGLVFGADGLLYYAKSAWAAPAGGDGPRPSGGPGDSIAVLCRMDPRTLRHEEVCTLAEGPGRHHYISRGARDAAGALYFAKVLAQPAGMYRVTLPGGAAAAARPDGRLRRWG